MDTLTPRQREILAEVCEGHTANEIAPKLGIDWRSREPRVECQAATWRQKSPTRGGTIYPRQPATIAAHMTDNSLRPTSPPRSTLKPCKYAGLPLAKKSRGDG